MSDWFFHMDEEDFQTFLMEEAAEKHIEEVTSMELPLDWDNYYDTDGSAAGVHAESIPDGLVKFCDYRRGLPQRDRKIKGIDLSEPRYVGRMLL